MSRVEVIFFFHGALEGAAAAAATAAQSWEHEATRKSADVARVVIGIAPEGSSSTGSSSASSSSSSSTAVNESRGSGRSACENVSDASAFVRSSIGQIEAASLKLLAASRSENGENSGTRSPSTAMIVLVTGFPSDAEHVVLLREHLFSKAAAASLHFSLGAIVCTGCEGARKAAQILLAPEAASGRTLIPHVFSAKAAEAEGALVVIPIAAGKEEVSPPFAHRSDGGGDPASVGDHLVALSVRFVVAAAAASAARKDEGRRSFLTALSRWYGAWQNRVPSPMKGIIIVSAALTVTVASMRAYAFYWSWQRQRRFEQRKREQEELNLTRYRIPIHSKFNVQESKSIDVDDVPNINDLQAELRQAVR